MPWSRLIRLCRQFVADRTTATYRSVAGDWAERDLTTMLLARTVHAIEVLEWRYIAAHWDRKAGKVPAAPDFPRLPGDPEPVATSTGISTDDLRAFRERHRQREEGAA